MIQPDDRSPDHSVDLPELLTRVDTDGELLRELLGIFNRLRKKAPNAVIPSEARNPS